MWYRYETHLHSSQCSACGKSTSVEMAAALQEKGYAGMILTDHFLNGNSCVPQEWAWADKVQVYYDSYLAAKEYGDTVDFDVLFGMEYYYGRSKEVLVYGLGLEFWLANPDIERIGLEAFSNLVHQAGGLVVQAHPFRVRPWMKNTQMEFFPELLDGVEVFNYCNTPEENEQALAWANAQSKPLLFTAGADAHWATHESLGTTGLAFPERIRTNAQLVEAMRSQAFRRIVNGEIVS